jgi:Fibronectin type III domain
VTDLDQQDSQLEGMAAVPEAPPPGPVVAEPAGTGPADLATEPADSDTGSADPADPADPEKRPGPAVSEPVATGSADPASGTADPATPPSLAGPALSEPAAAESADLATEPADSGTRPADSVTSSGLAVPVLSEPAATEPAQGPDAGIAAPAPQEPSSQPVQDFPVPDVIVLPDSTPPQWSPPQWQEAPPLGSPPQWQGVPPQGNPPLWQSPPPGGPPQGSQQQGSPPQWQGAPPGGLFEFAPGAAVAVGVPDAGVPAETRRGRRKRVALLAAVACVVVFGLVAGLFAWAPWRVPPVLRPAGLTASSSTTTSVAFRWAAPATGPEPDRYLILHDGKTIGSVAGTVTSYRVTGLIPGTSYEYRVAAVRGGKRSPLSALVVAGTPLPPIPAARWQGSSVVDIKVVRGISYLKGADLRQGWVEPWVSSPACSAGPCSVRLSAHFNRHTFKMTLTRAGGVYTGKTKAVVFGCNSAPVTSTLTVRVSVDTAQMNGPTWAVSSWAGTMVVSSPYILAGDYYCNAFTLHTSLSGTGGL